MCHIFFIHSLVEGVLSCFQVLVNINNASMNINEHVSLWHDWASFQMLKIWDIPKVSTAGIAGVWGRFIFIFFWKTTILISKVTVQVWPSNNSEQVFLLLHILCNIKLSVFFDLNNHDRYKMVFLSHFDLDFHECWTIL